MAKGRELMDRPETERWYEFEQRETFVRPIYVKATSLAEARAKRFSDEAIPDYPPNFPIFDVCGHGRIAADQTYVDELAASPERARRTLRGITTR